MLKPLTGYTGAVAHGPERAGDVKHSLADISKAQQYLGYKPLVGFEEGLRRTVAWYLRKDTSTNHAAGAVAVQLAQPSSPILVRHGSQFLP
jgi:dTDP-D-glucose 4,6-dehydratase